MTEMFTHLGRPGGTVQTDHVDTEWLECRQRRTDLTAQEHRSSCLYRHVRDDRQPQSELLHRTLAAEDCSFHLKQVLAGFDEDGVGATVDHAERSFGVRVTQDCVRCVSQAGELGSRSHRAEYESGHAVAAWSHLVRYFTGESSAFFREFADPVRDVVVGEVGQVATEGVGLDGIGTSGEVRTVDVFEHVGTGVVEDLIAPLEAEEVVQGEVRGLQHGAHRSVADDNALFQRIKQGRVKWGRQAADSGLRGINGVRILGLETVQCIYLTGRLPSTRRRTANRARGRCGAQLATGAWSMTKRSKK